MCRVLTVVICIGIACTSTANLSSPLIDETLSVITIADSGEVFVAGENIIYKLSANLSQLMNVTVSNDGSVRVRGLSVSNGGQYIMACLTTGSCIGYDAINLNRTAMLSIVLDEPEGDVFTDDFPVVMFPGAAEGIVYTGTFTETQQRNRMSLGRYRISGGSIMADTTRDYTTSLSFTGREFKAGFSVDNLIYYLVQDGDSEIRILRVCNESTISTFQALYEARLVCGQGMQGQALLGIFSGVSILKNENTLVLTVRSSDIVELAARSGRVCTYNISDINAAMDNGLTTCSNGRIQDTPLPIWDTDLPSFDPPAFCSSSYDVSPICI